MRPRLSERSLRRAVAELSGLAPEDQAGVLDRLDEHERATIRALLATLETQPLPDLAHEVVSPRAPDLSPWLKALLAAEPGALQLTPTALQALREAAGRHGWTPTPAPHLQPTWTDTLLRGWRSR